MARRWTSRWGGLLAVGVLCAAGGCATLGGHPPAPRGGSVETVLRTQDQLTGVALARGGRLFVSFPNWVSRPTLSVAERRGETLAPFPSAAWNAWDGTVAQAPHTFVCVQSVWADRRGSLWIMDPGSPGFAGVVDGAAKLVRVDLETNQVARVYPLGPDLAPLKSYLNDVRVDPSGRFALMADAMLGALVVLDLHTGQGRRLLEGHPSTSAEPDVSPILEGRAWLDGGGKPPRIAVDGLEVDPTGRWLYFQALTGRTLYRVPLSALTHPTLGPAELGARVERVARTHPADGIAFGADRRLYVTDLENGALSVVEGDVTRRVAADPRMQWPDTLAIDPEGRVYVTASQIHRMPAFNGGEDKREPPFLLLRWSPER